jgi:hypothetical protein
MRTFAMTKTNPTDAQIRDRAYLIWLDEGQPQGRDTQHWQMALAALTAQPTKAKPAHKAAAKPRAKKATPTKKL